MRRYDKSLSTEQRGKLRALAEAGRPRVALRSRLILRHFDGLSCQEVAAEFGISPQTVRKWRRRYLQSGISGLGDRPRPGRPHRLPLNDLQQLIGRVLQQPLPEGQQWSVRRVAKALGLSNAMVGRAWKKINAAPRGHQGLPSTRSRKRTSEDEPASSTSNDEYEGVIGRGTAAVYLRGEES